jgi:hypothetical protein
MLGWVALLLISVSFQVVPMFQVTPEYHPSLRRWLVPLLLMLLILWTVLSYFSARGFVPDLVVDSGFLFLLFSLLLFAVLTFRLQQQRRRRISDVMLLFWRLGQAAVLFCVIAWILQWMLPALSPGPTISLVIGVGSILGAAVSLLNGMLYKIVPFLSWFHLQNRQLALMCLTVQVPNMKQLLPDRAAFKQFWLHSAALLTALAAVWQPHWFVYPAGVLLALSSWLLWINLLLVVVRYRRSDRELREFASRQTPASQRAT